MRPGLLNKRSNTLLGQLADSSSTPPAGAITQCASGSSDRTENVVLSPDVVKLRRTGSRVWSDIRGAIKANGKTGQNGSEASLTVEHVEQVADDTRSITSRVSTKGKSHFNIEEIPSQGRWSKGTATKDFVRRLRHLGLASHGTVVLRHNSNRRQTSLHAPANIRSASSSEAGSSPLSDESIVEDECMRKASIDSRFSVVMSNAFSKRGGRRHHPWTRSSPDFTLGTIEETGLDHFQPTIKTVETAAAAKIYLETHFNEKLHRQDSRNARRQYLETQLYYSPHLTEDQKDVVRGSFCNQETCHMRETRVLKSRTEAAGTRQNPTPYTNNYEPLKILGKGSFGVVKLVRERSEDANPNRPKQVFAMKVIRKSEMLRSSQEGHLRAERDFLVASEGANWVVSLVCSFQDAANLYLVMEYMPGGDFLGLLIRENILHEAVARFYIAEMILAVEEAHRLRFIHRDIKPDNFLISATGHLKISDFGLAFDGHWSHDVTYYNYHRYSLLTKLGVDVEGDEADQKENREIHKQIEKTRLLMAGLERHERKDNRKTEGLEDLLSWRNRCGNRTSAHSVVGTSQYMAPESIGIILYECLYGHTPFLSDKGRRETKQNILEHKKRFYFPLRPYVSDKCQDLMYRLIREKDTRLCSRRYQMKDRGQLDAGRPTDFFGRYVFADDGEDIKAHRWFKNVPWDKLHAMAPPFVPHVHGPEDTRYFDESGSIDDMTDSQEGSGPSPEDLRTVLQDFRPSFQNLALELVAEPYDTIKLQSINNRIDGESAVTSTEKDVLKQFVRMYGHKERNRPRDRVLRDEKTKDVAMEVRKKTAFMGYTWKRMRPDGYLGLV